MSDYKDVHKQLQKIAMIQKLQDDQVTVVGVHDLNLMKCQFFDAYYPQLKTALEYIGNLDPSETFVIDPRPPTTEDPPGHVRQYRSWHPICGIYDFRGTKEEYEADRAYKDRAFEASLIPPPPPEPPKTRLIPEPHWFHKFAPYLVAGSFTAFMMALFLKAVLGV